jgi:hypothetical protein
MADLSAICAQLIRIRQELNASQVFTSGRPDEAEKADQENVFLENIKRQLEVLIRELNSRQSSLQSRQKQLWNVPLNQRYSAGQSLRQQSSNVEEAYRLAKILADTVRTLLDRNGLLNPVQKAKDIIELGEEIERTLHPEMNPLASSALHTYIRPATADPAHLDAGGVSALIAFSLLAVSYFQKKKRKGPKQ